MCCQGENFLFPSEINSLLVFWEGTLPWGNPWALRGHPLQLTPGLCTGQLFVNPPCPIYVLLQGRPKPAPPVQHCQLQRCEAESCWGSLGAGLHPMPLPVGTAGCRGSPRDRGRVSLRVPTPLCFQQHPQSPGGACRAQVTFWPRPGSCWCHRVLPGVALLQHKWYPSDFSPCCAKD